VALEILGQPLERERSLAELLKRPGVSYVEVMRLAPDATTAVDPIVAQQVETVTKYAGYIERQQEEVARRRGDEDVALPEQMDYAAVRGLSVEVRQKLTAQRPQTIGQASRISGVTPAAIALLLVHLKRRDAGAAREVA
jgi:tRNA uridine 5-carboxymethylaminomethyl modification enzyme